jgi:hypothetical protein
LRFAAPHARRSKLKASVNNALLGDSICSVARADPFAFRFNEQLNQVIGDKRERRAE